MDDDLVMRSVYLPAKLDAQLRQLAHESGYSKSDLIRAAATLKVGEWTASNGSAKLKQEVTAGLRETSPQRKVAKMKPVAVPQAARAKAAGAPAKAEAKPTTRRRPRAKPATSTKEREIVAG